MKVIEAIGQGVGIASRNVGLLVVLFIFNAFWNIAQLPFIGNIQSPADFKPTPSVFLTGLIFILLNIFMQGGTFGILKDAIASNGKAALGNLAKYGSKFYLRLLGIGVVVLFGVLLAILAIGLMVGIATIVKNIIVNIILGIIGLVLVGVGLYYLFLLFLSPYVAVMEDAAIFKAMGRSLCFVRAHLLKMFGLLILLVLIGFGLGFVGGIIGGLFSLVVKGIAFQVLTGVITGAVNAYITLIISAALMIYYSALSGTGKACATEGVSASV